MTIMSRILIIDDQPHVRELFSHELINEGYKVVSVSDPESAKRCMRNLRPDLVLLDLFLNGFKGWDLLREIKGEYPELPVIILTAYAIANFVVGSILNAT